MIGCTLQAATRQPARAQAWRPTIAAYTGNARRWDIEGHEMFSYEIGSILS